MRFYDTMAKKYLINEEDANDLLNHLANHPYKDVYKFCDVLRSLQDAPDLSTHLKQYHDFIVSKGLYDEFVTFTRWTVDVEDDITHTADQS